MKKYLELFRYKKKLKFKKKYLPILLLVFGIVIFSGVAINRLYLNKRDEVKEDKLQQSNLSQKSENPKEEVIGVQKKLEVEPAIPTTSEKQNTPTNKPETKSDEQNDSNSNSNNSVSNTTTVIVVTATPVPTSTTTPTNTPTPIPPTPTPDTRSFEATMANDGNTYIVTANKPLQNCQFVEATSESEVVISGDGEISDNVCVRTRGSPSFTYFGMKVTSIYSEEKILGNSPPDYW